jgi:putative redox protein
MNNERRTTSASVHDHKFLQTVRVGGHQFAADVPETEGAEPTAPDPHDLLDGALASCKATTLLWYARRKGLPLERVEVDIDRDASRERAGEYHLTSHVRLFGPLTDAQRAELHRVASKCPIHKLLTQVKISITDADVPAPAAPAQSA